MRKTRKQIEYYDETDEDTIIPDGGSVSVPLELMDGLQRSIYTARNHRHHLFNAPHYAQLTDAQIAMRTEARDAYIKQTCEAWKTAGRDQKPVDPPDDPDDDDISDRDRARRARNRYLDQLQNAWKGNRGVVGFSSSAPGPSRSVVGPGPTGDSGHRPMLSLADVRARIKKMQDSVTALKHMPVPPSDIKEKVRAHVQNMTRPIIGGIDAGEALTVQWPTGLNSLMAFLQPDVLVDRLMAEINRIANTPWPLAQREQKIAELEQEVDRLQRTEEAIVVATGAAREWGCPRWVVLGVKAIEVCGVRAA